MVMLKVSLITGRTVDQGCGKEYGKLSEEYLRSVAICEIDPNDMKRLKIREGDNVKVSTSFGSVTLKVKKSIRAPHSGVIFIPYGPWANLLMNPKTDGTGMPSLKGIEATIEPTEEKILELQELLLQNYSDKKLRSG